MNPQQFLAEEKELRAEHNDEYSVFSEVPEMHPEYEAKYEQFITCYRQRTTDADPELEESIWSAYWAEELEKLKQEEWQEKRKKLVNKYKEVLIKKKAVKSVPSKPPKHTIPSSSMEDSLPTDSVLRQSLAFDKSPSLDRHKQLKESMASAVEETMPNSEENFDPRFSFATAYSVLEGLCGSLDILGTALKGLINMARDSGIDTPGALKIFTDADNVSLVKMSMEKLKLQVKSAPPSQAVKLKYGIATATELLKQAELGVQSQSAQSAPPSSSKETNSSAAPSKIIMDDIDMDLIAKATLGKNPGEILNFINSTLSFEGKSANNEELTAIYLSISALHMSMSLQNPSSASSSPPISMASTSSQPPSQSVVKQTHSSYNKRSAPASAEDTLAVSLSMPLKLPTTSQTASDILMASMSESLDLPILPGLPASESNSSSTSYAGSNPPPNYSSAPPHYSAAQSHYSAPPPSQYSNAPPSHYTAAPPPHYHNSQTQSHYTNPQVKTPVKVTPQEEDSWFVQQVKCALSDPTITIEKFNKQLATIFVKKPRDYKFSASDLNLASELQQLGTSNYSGDAFIAALKKILRV